jgi:hypothetical protein
VEQQPDGIEKEDVQVIDLLVRRLLSELGDAAWGRNTPFRRKWTLTGHGTTWQVRPAAGPQGFIVSADLSGRMFRVDCAGGPLFTATLAEEQLRRALAVAGKRGPDILSQ